MAEQRTRFVGTHEHGLDDKGRMVLPSKIRGLLGETGMVGMLDECLGLWTLGGFDDVVDEFKAKVDAGLAPREDFRVFMAYAADVTPDQQGRVVIPHVLRTYAGLGSDVVVNGNYDRAEIWDKRRWDVLAAGVTTASVPTDDGPDDATATRLSSTMAALRL